MNTLTRRLRGDRERGSSSVLVAILASTLLLAIAVMVDGGEKVRATTATDGLAREAARAGAQAVSDSSVTGSTGSVDPARARAAVHAFMPPGTPYTVDVSGTKLTVTITTTSKTVLLSAVGVDSLPVRASQTVDLRQVRP